MTKTYVNPLFLGMKMVNNHSVGGKNPRDLDLVTGWTKHKDQFRVWQTTSLLYSVKFTALISNFEQCQCEKCVWRHSVKSPCWHHLPLFTDLLPVFKTWGSESKAIVMQSHTCGHLDYKRLWWSHNFFFLVSFDLMKVHCHTKVEEQGDLKKKPKIIRDALLT